MSSIQLDRIDVAMPQPCSQAFTQLPFTCSTVKLTASDGKLGEGLGMRLQLRHIALRAPTSCLLVSVEFLVLMLALCVFLDFHCFPIQHKQCKKEQQEKLQNTQQTRLVTCVPMERSLMTQFFLSQPATSTDLLLLVHLHNSIILQE